MVRDPEWDMMTKKAREKYVQVLRSVPLGKRFEITAELCDLQRQTMAAGIRRRHPEFSEEEVRRELIKMIVPEELRKKAYGW